MSIIFSIFILLFVIITCFLTTLSTSAASQSLHPDELNALKEIATTLGIKRLNLSAEDPCNIRTLMIIQEKQDVLLNSAKNNSIVCDCSFNNNMTCHIKVIELKTLSLPGKLPPQLAKLRYLQKISVCANRLTGNLPRGLENFKNLIYLSVEANQFSGTIPDELGDVTSLTTLHLASNYFTGSLPSSLDRLVNLEDVYVNVTIL
uniref:Leucine-rich repeat-containing N-terminal plant-type domain-containing protein n=1 Tax=Brassica oleracea var. oleracea TaxID=109376 RepID=A0A0D3CSX3_BRAOL